MPPPKATKKVKTQKKEKLFHPLSRKADQLIRAQHRQSKLAELTKARHKKHGEQVDIFNFFYQCLPPDGTASLPLSVLHVLVRDVWLARYDSELEEEKKSRRKGRPKSVREQKIEELKLREAEEYRTGLEVIDLTHAKNVELFRRWDQKEAAFIDQLRFIRISSASPDVVVLSRPGKHVSLKTSVDDAQTEEMDTDEDEAPLLLPSHSGSTIMTMDNIPQ